MRWTIHPAFFGASRTSIDYSGLARVADFAPAVFGVNAGAGADITSAMSAGQMQTAVSDKITSLSPTYDGARLAYWDFEAARNEAWGVSLYIQAQNACEAGGPLYTWGSYNGPVVDLYKTTDAEQLTAVGAINDSIATLVATCQVHTPDFYTVTTTTSDATAAARTGINEVRRAIAGASVTRIVPFIQLYRQPGVALTSDLVIATLKVLAENGIREFALWGQINNGTEASAANAILAEWSGPFAREFGTKSFMRRSAALRGRGR